MPKHYRASHGHILDTTGYHTHNYARLGKEYSRDFIFSFLFFLCGGGEVRMGGWGWGVMPSS